MHRTHRCTTVPSPRASRRGRSSSRSASGSWTPADPLDEHWPQTPALLDNWAYRSTRREPAGAATSAPRVGSAPDSESANPDRPESVPRTPAAMAAVSFPGRSGIRLRHRPRTAQSCCLRAPPRGGRRTDRTEKAYRTGWDSNRATASACPVTLHRETCPHSGLCSNAFRARAPEPAPRLRPGATRRRHRRTPIR